jgi:hypothetical protein
VRRLPDLLADVGHAPAVLGQEGGEVGGHAVHLPGDGQLLLQLLLTLRVSDREIKVTKNTPWRRS